MPKLTFFDCNCSVGRLSYPLLYDISDAAGLRREMDAAGIEEALVYHTVARDADPKIGNELLHEAIAEFPGLYPVWVIVPHDTGEMPPPSILLKDMQRLGAKAVRMFPGKDHHGFSLAEWNCGELLGAIEDAKVPLILDIEIVWWESIRTILENHPHLPIIASNVSYRHNRFTYPLFARYNNLHIETSRYFGAGTFEDVVGRFGPEVILFGTNMPQYTGTAAVSMLTYADIPREAKEAIAGGTLKKLLREAFS